MDLNFKDEWGRLSKIGKKYTVKDFNLLSKKIVKESDNFKLHTERLYVCVFLNDKDRLWGSMLDLFFSLGNNNTQIKKEAIVLCTKLLSKSERNILLKFFNKGLDKSNKYANGYSKLCFPSLLGRKIKSVRGNVRKLNILETDFIVDKNNEQQLLDFYKFSVDKHSFYKMKVKYFNPVKEDLPSNWENAYEYFQLVK